MRNSDCIVRPAKADEHRQTESLCREAFWNVYRPGCLEHYVLHCLRNHADLMPELDLVMEVDGKLVGQNIFAKAVIHADDGTELPVMTMGPIGILPGFQRQGYGKILLDRSLEKAAAFGCPAVCLEGNIRFYGKSGFSWAREFGLRYRGLPAGADDSFFLCKELRPGYLHGVSGEYAVPEVYCVDEKAAAEFDRAFPPKVKRKLPTQIF